MREWLMVVSLFLGTSLTTLFICSWHIALMILVTNWEPCEWVEGGQAGSDIRD
jgi:hypothetical protein